MNVKQAIQSSANVVRVTSVSAGDVYKRFDESYDDRVSYGIVQAVHNDGETAIIEALEYTYRYSSLDIELKILRGDKDYRLFPATPEDLSAELGDVVERKRRDIEKKQEEIAKTEKEIKAVEGILSGETMKSLKAMSYKELTQTDYEKRKLAASF